MTKVTLHEGSITKVPKRYTRLVLSENDNGWHRLVETKNGQLEYHLGVGKRSAMTPRKFATLVRSIVQAAQSHQLEYLAIELSQTPFPKLKKLGDEWVVRTMAENLVLASYKFTKYKSAQSSKQTKTLKQILVCGKNKKSEIAAFKAGIITATATNVTRDIANSTADDMTPAKLVNAARKAVSGTKVKVSSLGEKQLTKLKMGLLLAVGQGSKNETKLITMEYHGGKKNEPPIVIVGKGITYDTGGLNVKPTGHMHDMHLDMSGGAAVVGTMAAVAKLRLKQNIIGLIPAAENAVSDKAMRAGDIVKSMSGKTVEILHTDAEGRLVLADALTYAKRLKPKTVIDIATLTGAALVALGQHANVVMSKDKKLQKQLLQSGEASGDYAWPLPLWEEYRQYLKSDRADLTNIAHNFSRHGGAIEGGTFLSYFAPDCPWAHIDMAPRTTTVPSDKLAKGASGEPVRLLVHYIEQQ